MAWISNSYLIRQSVQGLSGIVIFA